MPGESAVPVASLIVEIIVATLLGLFVGLERERNRSAADGDAESERSFAGIRTFAIVSLTGWTAALAGERLHASVFVSGLAIVGVLAALAHFMTGSSRRGTTTEVAFVLTYLVGGLVRLDQILLAATVALFLTATLATKFVLHRFARAVSNEDVYSAIKFAAITLVVLPLLPDKTYDPLEALNPSHIWLTVVLMSGISFVGYVLVKAFGPRAGIGLTGLLGGLVSSTATTLTFSQRSRSNADLARGAALAILLACTVMYPRVAIVAAVADRSLALALVLPLGAILLVSLAIVAVLFRSALRPNKAPAKESKFANPFELVPAIKFAAVFAIVLLGIKFAQREFGERGTFVAAFVAGLTDMDAVTLSMGRLRSQGGIENSDAVAAVVLASVSNTIVKAGIVWVSGARGLRIAAGVPLVLIAAVSLVVFFLLSFFPI